MRPARALAGCALACLVLSVPGASGTAPTPGATGTAPVRGGTPLLHRYLTDASDGATTLRYGYDLVDTGTDKTFIDHLPRGQRALVWLGDYDGSTCAFEISDAEVVRTIAPLARDRRVAGFYIADEADDAQTRYGGGCTGVAAAVAARSALVHRVAPGHFTYEVLTEPGTFADFAAATDVMGVDPYPCRVDRPCDWKLIPRFVAALRAAHVRHYWGVLQAFAYEPWRLPTADELRRMVEQWSQTCWEGEQTFAWTYQGYSLAQHPRLLAVLAELNRSRTARPSRCTGGR